MPAHRSPPWTAQEIAILHEVYATAGINAAVDALPDRSWLAIQQKASKLGVRSPILGQAPRPKLTGSNLREAVRLRSEEHWSFARIGATFGVSESAACNAVMIELCRLSGHRPARRDETGRLLPEEIERLRLMLRKGLKAIDIQLRMGLSAGRIAEERRRYSRDLKSRDKAPLPPPGGGQAYSGAKLTKATRRQVEALLMEGFGTLKISERAAVSKTSVTRIRSALVRRLKRKGETLPGCDSDGIRRVQKASTRFIPVEMIQALRERLLKREPVRSAAFAVGIGLCSAYRIRDALAAELAAQGKSLPSPVLPGRVARRRAAWLPPEWVTRHRALVAEIGLLNANEQVRREMAEAARKGREDAKPRTFEEKLAAVKAGAKLSATFTPVRAGPDATMGGVATGMII